MEVGVLLHLNIVYNTITKTNQLTIKLWIVKY